MQYKAAIHTVYGMHSALTSRIFCVDFWSLLTLPEFFGSCARVRFDEYLWCH